MPFREKARKLFKSKTSRSDSSSKSSGSDSSSRDRYPSNVYRPDEQMPRPKYRVPPKKEHKEKLEAFSFADSWRRRSFQSTYSPMGTRAPSRRGSFLSSRLHASRPVSRTGSVVSSGEMDVHHLHPHAHFLHPGTARPREAAMATQLEQEGDDDVANVGLSRVQSRRRKPADGNTGVDSAIAGTAYDHQPFSEHDLSLALQRSNLTITA